MADEQVSSLDEVLQDEAAQEGSLFGADDGLDDQDIEVVIDDTPEEPAAPAEPEEPAVAAVAPTEPEEPAPVEGVPTVTDADLEETDKAYPEPIKKRIKREIRIRKKVEAEFEQVKDAAIKAVQYAQSQENEVKSLRTQLADSRKQHADVLEVAYDKEIQLKTRELRHAREQGNYDDEMKYQSELDTLRFQKNQVAEHKRLLSVNAEQNQQQTSAPQQQTGQQQQAPQQQAQREPPAPLAVAWITNNKAWFSNPKFAGHKQFALGVDTQLVREGYNKMTKEYYDELDRRIDEAFPTLRKKVNGSGNGVGNVPPVAPVGGGNTKPVAKGAVKLTRADLQNMRRFGMDPSNKEHLKEYARSKRSSE